MIKEMLLNFRNENIALYGIETMLENAKEFNEEITEEEENEMVKCYLENKTKSLESINDCIDLYKYLENFIELEKKEVERLKKRIEKKKKLNTFINDVICNYIEDNEKKLVRTNNYDISVRHSKSVNIVDNTIIDKKYIKTKIIQEISKIDIRKDLINDVKVDGAELKINKKMIIK